MNPLLAPLTLPPRLLARALDDLHAIALVARDADKRLDAIQEQMDVAIDIARQIERRGAEAIAMGERIDARAEAVLALGERIDARAAAILDLGEHIDLTADRIIAEGRLVQERAREVAEQGAAVVATLPTLRRAVEIAEPLEGAVERLGRIVDRLPGGGPPRQ